MALAIVLTNNAWTALGLADGRLLSTVAQVGIEVLVGLVVFLGASALLRMNEVFALVRVLLRRQQPVEAIAS
jgi:hypothetical protein